MIAEMLVRYLKRHCFMHNLHGGRNNQNSLEPCPYNNASDTRQRGRLGVQKNIWLRFLIYGAWYLRHDKKRKSTFRLTAGK